MTVFMSSGKLRAELLYWRKLTVTALPAVPSISPEMWRYSSIQSMVPADIIALETTKDTKNFKDFIGGFTPGLSGADA
jgi:hypothetical protein